MTSNSTAWMMSGFLYLLGITQAYLAMEPFDEPPRWLAIFWPIISTIGVVYTLWNVTLGGWLWRRRHAKWCAVTSGGVADQEVRS